MNMVFEVISYPNKLFVTIFYSFEFVINNAISSFKWQRKQVYS